MNTSALSPCNSDCDTPPASITCEKIGTCEDILTPIYFGQTADLKIAAVIEWDPSVGCFILTVEGTGAASSDCQQQLWVGYGPLCGPYIALCNTDACAANLPILVVTVTCNP